ncbi:MAG: PSD1 and planctomycete cytochrome C domain-containing protein [Planctomycetota bacterium]|nr:PSD1 and planctomycete cytochrome C domain-containing protein [Planctomycetota bacterium]
MTSLLTAIVLLTCSSQGLLFAEEEAGAPVDFAREVLPILSNKCFVCHGPDSRKKDLLRLDSYAGATKDLGDYQAINPKDPAKSEILVRLHSARKPMPPKKAEKQLTEQERTIISRWVRQGGKYAMHWAFIPPAKEKPAAKKPATGNDIDAFILARLQAKKLGFAPEADRANLARRAALVLTGLPPEPELLKQFLADSGAKAYGKLVDQLLESPRYGEHQARYWLDAVRYGDTHGLHLDNKRGIYPYRDWVVYAFNSNLRMDDFITWQLAGDLLPKPTLQQRVATGFVRMNPTTAEGGAIPLEFQAKNNFDRTETLGTVLLGMTLTCARCHTHKYDPIPQTEYYQLLAFFNSTAEKSMDGNSYTYAPVIKAPSSQQAWIAWNKLNADGEKLLGGLKKEAAATIEAKDANKWKNGSLKDRLLLLATAGASPAKEEGKKIADALAKSAGGFTTTLVAKDLGKPRVTRVLHRGEYDQPVGAPLQPGTLSIMNAFPEKAPRNRLGLARWLTSREHPLVSRVLVNRVWQRVFGDGIVRTPEDFGLQGQQPTHPELLDWLAVELQESEWDLKHMLRLMVTSRTFRQDSTRRKEFDDPENRLFARGPSHRLDAEVLRDIALWSSQLLAPEMGGEGIKPYQPAGLWSALMHPASNTKRYVADKGEKLYRRSLYVYWKRTSPHPMMTLFDAPSRESSCVKRSRTNTSLQSLGLFNETQRVEMGRKLAERILKEADDDRGRLDLLFTLLACRKANDNERKACQGLLDAMRNRYKEAEKDAIALLSMGEAARDKELEPAEHAAWTQVAITILASDLAILLY